MKHIYIVLDKVKIVCRTTNIYSSDVVLVNVFSRNVMHRIFFYTPKSNILQLTT